MVIFIKNALCCDVNDKVVCFHSILNIIHFKILKVIFFQEIFMVASTKSTLPRTLAAIAVDAEESVTLTKYKAIGAAGLAVAVDLLTTGGATTLFKAVALAVCAPIASVVVGKLVAATMAVSQYPVLRGHQYLSTSRFTGTGLGKYFYPEPISEDTVFKTSREFGKGTGYIAATATAAFLSLAL
jgi:hypothetical protein